MELREKAPCCGARRLAWDRDKALFVCGCGKMKASAWGRRVQDAPARKRRRKEAAA